MPSDQHRDGDPVAGSPRHRRQSWSGRHGGGQSTTGNLASTDRSRSFGVVIGRALGAVVVTVHGRLDADAAQVLDRYFHDLIDGQGNLLVVVDLADAAIAAGGIDVLVKARRSLRARGGRLLLGRPSRETANALHAAGLGDAIELHPERRHHPTAGGEPSTGRLKGPRRAG